MYRNQNICCGYSKDPIDKVLLSYHSICFKGKICKSFVKIELSLMVQLQGGSGAIETVFLTGLHCTQSGQNSEVFAI